MIRSMLYATDLGVYAPYVMQHALAMARTFKADLYVIHVVEPIGLFAESVLQSYLDDEALNDWQAQGVKRVMASIEQRVLDSFREELADGEQDLQLIRSVRVIQGDPAQAILAQAEKLSVDLLIVGSHSQGPGVAAPLGRTAARVLQLCKVPVYLVPLLQCRRGDDV
ncbi:universal stress protein [Pseudomonas mucidolens]|uniref:universal stress protein n=1 Tax=Pseudomonas mucidolens TaxID=46679 RepID=UPI0030DD7EB9